MTQRILNGDYVKDIDTQGLQTVEYMDELVQVIKMLLITHRGQFYPNKDFGSMLRCELPAPAQEYALAYARQALEGLDGVFVRSANVQNGIIIVDLVINGEEKQVEQSFEDYI